MTLVVEVTVVDGGTEEVDSKSDTTGDAGGGGIAVNSVTDVGGVTEGNGDDDGDTECAGDGSSSVVGGKAVPLIFQFAKPRVGGGGGGCVFTSGGKAVESLHSHSKSAQGISVVVVTISS